MYSRKFGLRLHGKFGNLRRLRRATAATDAKRRPGFQANTRAAHSTSLRVGSVLPRQGRTIYFSEATNPPSQDYGAAGYLLATLAAATILSKASPKSRRTRNAAAAAFFANSRCMLSQIGIVE
jgi:hypothetical protein